MLSKFAFLKASKLRVSSPEESGRIVAHKTCTFPIK